MKNNTVQLLGFYGNDEIHACSAWTSTSRDITEEKKARIPKLLKALAEQGHYTPFEKSSLHFLMTSEIASHIHLLKHRIGVSINGESARYKELKEDRFYVPDDWDGAESSKQLIDSNGNTLASKGEKWSDILNRHTESSNQLYHSSLHDLESVIGRKRAKESARFFKSYNSQIDCDIMFNWRSFYHFLSLRNKPESQKEIREIAAEMLNLVQNIDGNPFKYTIEAFGL